MRADEVGWYIVSQRARTIDSRRVTEEGEVSENEGERRGLSIREDGSKDEAMSTSAGEGEGEKSEARGSVRAMWRMSWMERTRTATSCGVERYAGSMTGSSNGSALRSVIEP